jgi:hypothetical protein
MMKMSPPNPVKVQYTDVALRNPRAVVSTSSSTLRAIRCGVHIKGGGCCPLSFERLLDRVLKFAKPFV